MRADQEAQPIRLFTANVDSREEVEVTDACDALMPLLWQALLDREFADLSCTSVVNPAGQAEAMLVKRSLSARNGQGPVDGADVPNAD